ncbi:dehydrogenase [Burkholderia gladioli]|uniref:Dehydrogenase n=1 Tax=Burkholderia gladioli TaxID=28095 RepID=A0A2A7S6X9_BURGA|nr:dehydrogenase [Burkholderia gladioli]ATF85305.1 dehydrogenase [Burkholderia gladioli pv. gladioli]MBJ9660977.1 dehydrogenase [Burkholderia gladioli]MBJ9710894.1 dehydrogenase [Burkholderia gladioli]MBU9155594.1 dehydrogenase [Burkholderia gladioli]MBU9197191.1 dehydrogenase [Burkholderia gladioli]
MNCNPIGSRRELVRARAPLRLGLAGGGTDVSPYSDDFGGLVLNATINRYAYATLAPRQDGRVELVAADSAVSWQGSMASSLGLVKGLELHVGVYNRIVRDYHGGQPLAVQITTHSEAPPGSGLGSSSTMVVALLHAFVEYLQIPLGEYEIAQLAYEIERVDLAFAGGKQDQYAAAFGGFNFMEFDKDRVIVNPLRVKQSVLAELESSLVLFYTGVSRESAKIIEEQTNSMRRGNFASVEAMHRVKQEAVRMKEAILKGDFDSFAESMRLSWEAKKKMASSISNATIDAIYDAAIAAGALAGKVSGAGGGGFMMFIVDPTRRPGVIRALGGFDGQVLTCNFTKHGAYSWRA